jgi:hypothetical protein
MISTERFLSRLMPHVPACPEPLAEQALLDTAISFCEHSNVIREDLDLFYTIPSIANYELDLPNSNYQVARVLNVTVDGELLHGIHEEQASGMQDMTAQPRSYYTRRLGSTFELYLYPTPDKRAIVIAHVALQPTRDATALADDLYNVWCEPLLDGALARITKVPGQAFTDFNASLMYQDRYANGVNRARIEGYYGRVRGASAVQQRPLA